VLLCAPICIYAENTDAAYNFELTVNGTNEVQVQNGDVYTVTLVLDRTDCEDSSTIYAVQDEIHYDSDFLEIIPDSMMVASGINTTDISLQGSMRAFYVNYVSFGGGETWDNRKMLGTFQVRIIGSAGSSTLENCNISVSTENGQDSYATTKQDVTFILLKECVIRFDRQNGEPAEEISANLGDRLTAPQEPVKDGAQFTGWYSDKALSSLWNFGSDTVSGNLTLYAGWKSGANIEEDSSAPVEQSGKHTGLIILIVAAAVCAGLTVVVFILRKRSRK